MSSNELQELQAVRIVLADGREGWFYGPPLITKEELKTRPPMIKDIHIVEPQVPQLPSAPEEKKPDENVAKPA